MMYVLLTSPIVALPKLVGSLGTKLRILQLFHPGIIHSWAFGARLVLVGKLTGNAKAKKHGGNNP